MCFSHCFMRQFYIYSLILFTTISLAQNVKIDSLTVRLAYQNQDSTKVKTSLLLIKELYRVKDFNKALLFIAQTSELSKSLDYKKGVAETFFIRGLINNTQGNKESALLDYKTARSYYSAIKDITGIAKVDNDIGIIEIKRGNYNIGLQKSLSAISVFEDEDLTEELSKAYNNIAEAYYSIGEYNQSIQYHRKALRVREQREDIDGIKHSLKNLGLLYALIEDYRRSIDHYDRILSLLNPEEDKRLLSEITVNLGRSYLSANEKDNASSNLLQGLTLSRSQDYKLGILKSLNGIGQLNAENQRFNLAEKQLNEANLIARQLGADDELLYNLKIRTDLHFNRNAFKDAFIFQKEYFELKEKLNTKKIEKEKSIATIPTTKNSKNQESSNETFLNKEDISGTVNASSKNNQLLTYGLIAGLIFTLALLIFIWLKNSKDSQEKNKYVKENSKLALKNAQLEEVNQVKDKLFSIVSHDLKDSISSIKAFLDLLKDGAISKEEFNNLIPELSENANNASSLLFNLLNWSKSQMQNLQPKPELFNIQEIFQIKISLIEKKVNDKGIILIDESKRDFVYADRSMMEIVIQNLITNAVKFSGKGDVITISNQDYNGNVLICVEDTGIGISQENQKKLFNAKKNFTTIGTENEKGTGLGLTICKDLVELNRGRIWVESTPNIGSKFFIELPKADPNETN